MAYLYLLMVVWVALQQFSWCLVTCSPGISQFCFWNSRKLKGQKLPYQWRINLSACSPLLALLQWTCWVLHLLCSLVFNSLVTSSLLTFSNSRQSCSPKGKLQTFLSIFLHVLSSLLFHSLSTYFLSYFSHSFSSNLYSPFLVPLPRFLFSFFSFSHVMWTRPYCVTDQHTFSE
jgi:hypothetical protein